MSLCRGSAPVKIKVNAQLRIVSRLLSVVVLTLGFAASASSAVDLTGTYNVATLTPLERPKMFGDKRFLTQAEAEKIRREDAAAKIERNNKSDPNRSAPPSGGDGSAGAAGNVGGYNTFWIDNGDKTFQLDGKFRTSILTQPENGRRPGLTGAAKAKFAQARRNRRSNSGTDWWLDERGEGAGAATASMLSPVAGQLLRQAASARLATQATEATLAIEREACAELEAELADVLQALEALH